MLERLVVGFDLQSTLTLDGRVPAPGAVRALQCVRRAGGAVVVVTGLAGAEAERWLARHDLEVDHVSGGVMGEDKAGPLRAAGAHVYVGDHPLDMAAARRAGAAAVGVVTGPNPPGGAEVELPSLTDFPGWLLPWDLQRRLRSLDSVLVAFSGGADSALVLAAAVRALGPERVVAATAVSASLPAAERAAAAAFTATLGVRHEWPRTDELAREGYRANSGSRCYFCKSELLDVLVPLAGDLGLAAVATGTNADDAVAGFRPGIRAADERGAVTPLRDAGFTKVQVREVSRSWGLPTWDKPAAACLSSRIAYGVEVTSFGLARVERAEVALRAALTADGYAVRDLRVRDLGDDTAKVEIDLDLVAVVPAYLPAVEGYSDVQVDPRGFRSGSMNEALLPRS